jgi:DUF4097 and DUF4098 domain-containing protein YvlB
MNKTSKTIITVLTIITIAAIIFGIYSYCFNGRFAFTINGGKTITDTYPLEGEITDIETNVDTSDIVVKYSDNPCVEYTVPEKLKPEISLNGGKLTITSPNKKNFSFNLSIFSDAKNVIYIFLPSDTKLERANLKTDTGDVEVNDISAKNLDIRSDTGDVKTLNTTSDYTKIDTDTGDIGLIESKTENLVVESDTGDVIFKKATIDTLDIGTDTGDIQSDDCNINGGKIKTDTGDITLNGDIGDISTKTDTGDVYVNGDEQ